DRSRGVLKNGGGGSHDGLSFPFARVSITVTTDTSISFPEGRYMLRQLNDRQEIWRGLLSGHRSMMLRLSAELKRDFGLNSAQFEALLTLVESPNNAMPATQLAQRLLYSSGSGSHLIARLEELGHVTRHRDAMDARMVVVALTES